MSFEHFGLRSELLDAIQQLEFDKPTQVQEKAIPEILKGRDVLGRAQTGTGKTAAYGLPILHRLLEQTNRRPRVLVILPTRELARQVNEQMTELARFTKLKGFSVTGGEAYVIQEHAFRAGGMDWIATTPGRLLYHLSHDYVDFSAIEYLVLDEADQLLDMGFIQDIRKIVSYLPEKRMTLLFSATLPAQMRELARHILTNPIRIDVGLATTAEPVVEELWPVPQDQKLDLLVRLLDQRQMTSALIFTRTKRRADSLANSLERAGKTAEVLHADRVMADRKTSLASFRAGDVPILVATDLAARGLDISGISHVINYDVPTAPEDYIHRVGRTGRAGRTGEALTFMSANEEICIAKIEHLIGKRIPSKRMENFPYHEERREDAEEIKSRSNRLANFNTRLGSKEKRESPFTKNGTARRGFEVPDPNTEEKKRRRKRVKIRKKLPHQR